MQQGELAAQWCAMGPRNLLWCLQGALCTTSYNEPEEHCVTVTSHGRGVSSRPEALHSDVRQARVAAAAGVAGLWLELGWMKWLCHRIDDEHGESCQVSQVPYHGKWSGNARSNVLKTVSGEARATLSKWQLAQHCLACQNNGLGADNSSHPTPVKGMQMCRHARPTWQISWSIACEQRRHGMDGRARPIDGSVAANCTITAIAAGIPGVLRDDVLSQRRDAFQAGRLGQVVPCVVSKQVVERLHGVLIAVDMTYGD
jgi:hypothetical protein